MRQSAAEKIWTWLNSKTLLLGTLTSLLIISLLTLLLPQSPVPPTDEAAFSRWLAKIRPTLGQWTSPLVTLQWLSLKTSLWQRIPLALLTLAMAARTAQLAATWQQRSTIERARQALICIGALFLLTGWGIHVRWGWAISDITAWPDETITLPERDLTLPPTNGETQVALHGYGYYLTREQSAIGLQAQAWNDQDVSIPLLTSTHGEPQEKLRLILNEQKPDAYFAIPSADLIFRANFQHASPNPTLLVQIYRSPSGELITETLINGSSGSLFTEDLRLQLESISIPQLRVTYNPGAPLTVAGWAALLFSGLEQINTKTRWWPEISHQQTDKKDTISEQEE